MTLGDLAALSATEIVALVKARQISPVEVVKASLDRIERCNPTLNAVVTLNEQAIEDARTLEASIKSDSDTHVLCGAPVGIKDLTPCGGSADHIWITDIFRSHSYGGCNHSAAPSQ